MGGRIKKAVALPAAPCTIADVPIGACVRIEFPTKSSIDQCEVCRWPTHSLWYQVTFKIGTSANGSRNLRLLSIPPSDLAWNDSPLHEHFVTPDVRVLEIAWPIRRGDIERAEVADPVGGSAGNGPLFADVATDE